jgi:hypothetical protein
MALPEIEDDKLYEEIEQSKEEKTMPVLTTAERIGERRGKKEGIRQAISDILEIKFGAAGLSLFRHIKPITDLDALQAIRMGLKQARSLREAEAVIEAHRQKPSGNGKKK